MLQVPSFLSCGHVDMIEDAGEMEAACLSDRCDQAHGAGVSGAPGADNADPDQDDDHDGTDDDSSRPSLIHSLAQDS